MSRRTIASIFFKMILIFFCSSHSTAGTIDQELSNLLASSNSNGSVDVIIEFSDSKNLPIAANLPLTISNNREQLVKNLVNNSNSSQKDVKSILGQLAIDAKSIWLNNSIAATIPENFIPLISSLKNVVLIKPDRKIVLESGATGGNPTQLDWNIISIGASDLWDVGVSGQGVIIGSMDTGVDINHPDLLTRWRGGSNSWFDPYGIHATPYDSNGHGTQTTSLMVGGSGSGYNIGVAPEAHWIAAKIFDDSDTASISAIHLAFQWMLDPDGDPATDDGADIVNNSWNFGNSFNQCDYEFQEDISILRSADVAVVFSSGNSGPSPETSHSPANNEDTISVGATDEFSNVAFFSSRGASACDDGVIYPKLTAPGVNVITADLTFGGAIPNSYTYSSGTSFAAPHVAAALALLQSKFPSSELGERENALYSTAFGLGPVNDYGNGIIDVQAAMEFMGRAQLISPTGNLGQVTTPIFEWNSVQDTTHYKLWIKNPDGVVNQVWYTASQASCAGTEPLCSISVTTPLDVIGYYNWKVRTRNNLGLGPWSTQLGFSIGSVPIAPTLDAPSGNLGTNNLPTFSWFSQLGATHYKLWIKNPAGTVNQVWYTPTQLNCADTETYCTIPSTLTLANGNYKWKVRSRNSLGLGPWSSLSGFSIGGPTPAPTLDAPSGNLGANNLPTFSWFSQADVTYYKLWIKNPAGTVSQVWYTPTQANCADAETYCSVPSTMTLANGIYSWKARSRNSLGLGPWSTKSSFIIDAPPL